jgi:formylglycine-generating enzyme required for sulfatase activity
MSQPGCQRGYVWFVRLSLPVVFVLRIPAVARPTVTSVRGDVVSLSLGSDGGIRTGMTGRLCSPQTISGKVVNVCPAAFQIVSVTPDGSEARVTRGTLTDVEVGQVAEFNQELQPSQPRGSPKPTPKPTLARMTPNTEDRQAAKITGLLDLAHNLNATGQCKAAQDKADEVLTLDRFNATAREIRNAAVACLLPVELIHAGHFRMGCTSGDSECTDAERPVQDIALPKPFYMARTLTKNAQYRECFVAGVCARSPDSQRPDYPVVNVSWDEAVAFCGWRLARLPTEAEWEYAARGGVDGRRYPWSNSISHDNANYEGTDGKDLWDGPSPVGAFPPNDFGLFDMAGNVWEWCEDQYLEHYAMASDSVLPKGSTDGQMRAARGGSWLNAGKDLRVSFRVGLRPGLRNDIIGFRCVRDFNSP